MLAHCLLTVLEAVSNAMTSTADWTLPTGVRKLFQGSKTFWRTRATLDIWVFRHCNLTLGADTGSGTLEIAMLRTDSPQEDFPRIYLRYERVRRAVKEEEFQELLKQKKEVIIRKKLAVDLAALSQEAGEELVVKYVLAHIHSERDPENSQKVTAVYKQTLTGDEQLSRDDRMVCDKPTALVPIALPKNKTTRYADSSS